MGIFQTTLPPTPAATDLSGKVAVVTGANSGLGLQAAREMLQLNVSTVVLAVRTVSKGEEAKVELLADPLIAKRSPPPQILVYHLDLASPRSVLNFANKVKETLPVLNILLLNAGVTYFSWTTCPESGFETMFQVNYLSKAILTHLLLPLLTSSAETSGSPSRLTFTSSRIFKMHPFSTNSIPESETIFDYFNDKKNFATLRYNETRLLIALWVRTFSQRVDPSKILINHICPGPVDTEVAQDMPFIFRVLLPPLRWAAGRSVEEGGRAVIYATILAGDESHGHFISDNIVQKDIPFLVEEKGEVMQKRLWDETVAYADQWQFGSL